MIKILTQLDDMILEVDSIKEGKDINNSYELTGIKKDGGMVSLAKYNNPSRSCAVMLYIVEKFNEDPNKIIRLPEDDEDVMNLLNEKRVAELEGRVQEQRRKFTPCDSDGICNKNGLGTTNPIIG